MSGLGIDLGLPSPTSQDGKGGKSCYDLRSMTSLNQFNLDRNSMYQSPSCSSSDVSTSTYSHGEQARGRTMSVPANRNRRLSLAVQAMQDGGDYDCESDVISDDSASPRTDTSADIAQTSRPEEGNLYHHQHHETYQNEYPQSKQPDNRVPSKPAYMIRSQSSYSATSNASQSSAMSSLGRSNATTRYDSRARVRTKRLASAPNVHGLASLDHDHKNAHTYQGERQDSRSQALKREKSVSDGFGGFLEAEDADDEDAGDTTLLPPADPSSVEQSRVQQADQRPADSEQASRPVSHPEAMVRSMSQPAHIAASSHHRMTVSQSMNGASFRVGSFYGPDGQEKARIDENGELYRTDDRSDDDRSCMGGSEISASSGASRCSIPRSHFMYEAGQAGSTAQKRSQGSEVSLASSSGALSQASNGSQVAATVVTMRSERGWRGLSGAERGEAFITIDTMHNTFGEGSLIHPESASDGVSESLLLSAAPAPPHCDEVPMRKSQSHIPEVHNTFIRQQENLQVLDRNGTLISATAHPARRSQDLTRLLGKSSGKLNVAEAVLKPGKQRKASIPGSSFAPALEQSRSGKGRVDVDLVLESDLVVEGGLLKGRLEIKVRDQGIRESRLMLTQPKIRVVGFEELLNDDTRHIFYHHATVIDGTSDINGSASEPYVLHGSPIMSPETDNRRQLPCFASAADPEGYCLVKEGAHTVPFSIEIPVGKGARGSFRGKNAAVRYIVIGSVKLKGADGSNRSIAHFYRHVDLYPYLNPAVVLSSAPKPLMAHSSKTLFLGGSGQVHLMATLHRHSWVAGQRLYVNLRINNETSKRIKNLSFALMRDVTLYRPRPELALSGADPDACSSTTTRKKIAEDNLELGQKGSKGQVTARGWWTGVEPGQEIDISHNIIIPHDALTLPRGRHVEVAYQLRVSAGSSLSSDVSVELPVRIFNFISLDPPPLKTTTALKQISAAVHPDEAPAIERVRTADAFRSSMQAQPHRSYQNVGQSIPAPVHYHEPQAQSSRGLAKVMPHSDFAEGQARRLQHQQSLDFINHAIRSATARRGGQGPPVSMQAFPQGLGIGVDNTQPPHERRPQDFYSAEAPDEYQNSEPSGRHAGDRHDGYTRGARHMNEDDLEDDLGVGHQTLVLNDESVADIDYVIGSARLDGGESSPAFEQRKAFEEMSNTPDDSRAVLPFSTDAQASRELGVLYGGDVSIIEGDDGATPLALSPPKFQDYAHQEQVVPGAYMDSPGDIEAQFTGYATSESSSISGHSYSSRQGARKLVRTCSDFDSDLGRSATIIRGPSNVARPVSPSKQTPSPTKSALKSGTYHGSAGHEDESPRSKMTRGLRANISSPPKMRAHVSNNQLSRPLTRAPLPHLQSAVPSEAGSNYGRQENDSEVCSGYSTSPATSVGVTTPTETSMAAADHRSPRMKAEEGYSGLATQMQGLGIAMGLPAAHFSQRSPASPAQQVLAVPDKDMHNDTSISRSSSTHTICGATVVVPSVRDKIAQLESRKRALRDFAIIPHSPSNSSIKTNNYAQQGRGNAHYLQSASSNSIQTDTISPSPQGRPTMPEYLRPARSISNFKAPIFH